MLWQKMTSKICLWNRPEVREESRTPKLMIDDPPWLKSAIAEVGVTEIKGPQHSPRILEYHQTTKGKFKSDEIAWCSAFINWCFWINNIPRTRMALARSWQGYGTEVDLESAKRGDLCVFGRNNSDWQGHVGLYITHDKKRVLILGGNQGDSVSYKWYPIEGKGYKLLTVRRPIQPE